MRSGASAAPDIVDPPKNDVEIAVDGSPAKGGLNHEWCRDQTKLGKGARGRTRFSATQRRYVPQRPRGEDGRQEARPEHRFTVCSAHSGAAPVAFAMLAPVRRVFSRVSNLAAAHRPDLPRNET